MFAMAMMLAVISTALEMYAVIQWEGFRRFMLAHEKMGLLWSLGMSYMIGVMFGAAGLIAMFGAILSTLLSLIIYRTNALSLVDKWRAGGRQQVIQMLHTAWGTIKFWGRVISAPYRACRWFVNKIGVATSEARSAWTRAKRAVHRVRA